MGRVELKDGPDGPWTCSVTVWRIFPARLSRFIFGVVLLLAVLSKQKG
jgi:hypothetical protein